MPAEVRRGPAGPTVLADVVSRSLRLHRHLLDPCLESRLWGVLPGGAPRATTSICRQPVLIDGHRVGPPPERAS